MASNVIFHNLMEDFVESKLDELMQVTEVCHCEQCRVDIISRALNRLPPKYIVTQTGDTYTRFYAMKTQFQADITTEVLNAIETVKKNAKHGKVD